MGYAIYYVLHFLLLLNYVKSQTIKCPDIYLRFSKDHSYCKPANATCKIEAYYLSKEEIDQVLNLHNSFRSTIATQSTKNLPTAANMLEMEWDNELAAVAQKRAEQCIFAHDTANQRRVQNFGVGQNIAIQYLTGQNLSPPQPDWTFAVTTWYEEIVYFRSDLVTKFAAPTGTGEEFRHFTQLIWADTFRVGCGYVLYHHGNTYTRLYVCNYGPAGNVYETNVWKIGPPGTQCPQNTFPVSKPFPGLCKRVNGLAPFAPLKLTESTLFNCNFQDPNSQDCMMNTDGPAPLINSLLGGSFLETVVPPGKITTISFSKALKPHSESFCVSIKYRKGPIIDGNLANNKATETFIVPNWNSVVNQPLQDNSEIHQFATFNMDLSWREETRMNISFEVPANANTQFFDIDSITAVDGNCEAYRISLLDNGPKSPFKVYAAASAVASA